MDVFDAIRTRRTVKAFTAEPVPNEMLAELFELARWAPNHRLTAPWRFRVVGQQSLDALKDAAAQQAAETAPEGAELDAVGAAAAAKLDRAPTLVVVSCMRCGDHVQHDEDMLSTGVAAYIVLLSAHARELAGYWRTPGILRDPRGREAVGVPDDEEIVGLLYLGRAAQDYSEAPARPEPAEYVSYLD
jgi:nitroreductase